MSCLVRLLVPWRQLRIGASLVLLWYHQWREPIVWTPWPREGRSKDCNIESTSRDFWFALWFGDDSDDSLLSAAHFVLVVLTTSIDQSEEAFTGRSKDSMIFLADSCLFGHYFESAAWPTMQGSLENNHVHEDSKRFYYTNWRGT